MMEESDYIMRQVKQMAKGLGKFMGLEQIKEILQLSESQQEVMRDEELESIILMTKIELIVENASYSMDEVGNKLGIGVMKLEELFNNERYADAKERKSLRQFVKESQEYL